jgi:hypothetical protein
VLRLELASQRGGEMQAVGKGKVGSGAGWLGPGLHESSGLAGVVAAPSSSPYPHPTPPHPPQSRTVLALMEPRVTPWSDTDSLEAWKAAGSLIGPPEGGS